MAKKKEKVRLYKLSELVSLSDEELKFVKERVDWYQLYVLEAGNIGFKVGFQTGFAEALKYLEKKD